MPSRGNSQPAMNAPTMPTTMLPIRPKPKPFTIRPASQPAMAPTISQMMMLSIHDVPLPLRGATPSARRQR